MNNSTKLLLLLGIGVGVAYLASQADDYDGNLLKGGAGDDLDPDDVDEDELEMGRSVEMEHTDDEDIAEEIALDHLAEDPKYYTKLKSIHKDNPSEDYDDEEEEEDDEDE